MATMESPIAELRARLGLSLDAFAKAIGRTTQWVVLAERGISPKRLKMETLEALGMIGVDAGAFRERWREYQVELAEAAALEARIRMREYRKAAEEEPVVLEEWGEED